MSIESDTRDRVVRLEEQFKHLSEKLDTLADRQDDTNEKVTGMHELLLKGQGFVTGARLILLGLSGIIGAAGYKLASLIPWFSGSPR